MTWDQMVNLILAVLSLLLASAFFLLSDVGRSMWRD